jgi:hypothetical protein
LLCFFRGSMETQVLNQSHQPTPGDRLAACRAPAARRGCARRWPNMSMKSASIVALTALVLPVGCRPRVAVQVPDVTKPITLTVSRGNAEARGVSVRIRGNIDGVAVLSGSGRYGTNRVHGLIDESYRDNYSTNFTLYYAPETVRTGIVTMQYVFH